MEMKVKLFLRGAVLCALAFATLLYGGCRKANDSAGGSSGTTPSTQAPTPPRTDLEQKLQYVRDGQFHHIYVFTRKDGRAFDKEDVEYLTANSPVGEKTNMRVKTEDGQRVVIGTNFEYTQEQFDALGKRFNIEDYTGK
jgi:hypothetical protein